MFYFKMVSDNIYQHYKSSEYSFVEKIRDLILKVEASYTFTVTDFLNPREVEIARTLCHPYGLQVMASSDYYPMEYSKVIIAPDYYTFDFSDFEITLVEIAYNTKFNSLTHSQILGTLINQLGIKRSIIGDILVQPNRAQLLIDSKMASYFITNVTKIGKASVRLVEIDFAEMLVSENTAQSIEVLVSSMRLDKIIATVLKLSRTQASALIEADKVKVNYQEVNKISELLQVGDRISIRGFGRFTIVSNNGFSKNGKYKLTVDKMTHK